MYKSGKIRIKVNKGSFSVSNVTYTLYIAR